jgi:Secretion system C-terminal sorting domain
MKKITLSLAAIALFSTMATAQVKYKLTRMADNATYMVSLVPDATWTFPQNITTTAQVSLRVPKTAHFIAGRITSLVTDTKWLDNSYLETPEGDANNNYVLFSLQSMGTKALTFDNGRELPLFSFQNIGTTCFGTIELVDNNTEVTKAVVAKGFNVGQHIATLGSNGEAFTGLVEGGKVNCQGITSAQDLDNNPLSITNVYPTPASTDVNVEWKLADTKMSNLDLIITNALGETIYTQPLTPSKGFEKRTIDVRAYSEGMYFLRLKSDTGVSKTKTFVVVH